MTDDHVDDARDADENASLEQWGIDPAELDRSEEFLAALGAGGRPGGSDSDPAAEADPLLALLADWRAEVDSAPLPALPSDEEIAAALAPNVTPLRSRRGWAKSHEHHHGERPALWQAVTGAAAVAAVIVGGLSVAAHSAMPGDPLWGVSKTMFSDRAGDVELVSDLSDHLAAADAAAREGDSDTAKRLLGEVSDRLDEVNDAAERVELMKRRDAIQRDLSRVTPTAVPSPEPEAPPVAPEPGPATLVPAPAPALPPTSQVPPPPGLPVIPLPLDGLRISTTLQIPIDPQRIQDFLSPTTAVPTSPAPRDDDDDMSVLRQPTTPTSVPTSAQTNRPSPEPNTAQVSPTR